MYGLLIEGLYYYLRTIFGEEVLEQIRKKANVKHSNFSTHKVYSETVIPRIARATQDITGLPVDEVMEAFGVAFISFVSRYGYDRILKVLGRNFRDFLSNLDNLHEYLRFSYPKIKPPSFFVADETPEGLTLHYRSKRKGFKHYVIGKVRRIGKEFYNTEVRCEGVDTTERNGVTHHVIKLSFDNSERFLQREMNIKNKLNGYSIESDDFFSLFPFHMVLNKQLVVASVGEALKSILPNLMGAQLDDLFYLEKPVMDFTWESVLTHTNCVFELQSVDIIENRCEDDEICDDFGMGEGSVVSSLHDRATEESTSVTSTEFGFSANKLKMRGQMIYMEAWHSILFLGTPIMENLDHMFRLGLYINDLSIHDSSRDLVLAGTQQSAELKLLLDQERARSRKLEDSMKRLDAEMRKTDQLLYQMIPKSVADRLRSGEPAMSTCEVFDICTILFSDVVGFTNICSAISPMQVVTMLNGMYTSFDTLIEKHNLYKVETIGDAYMIVGGVPEKSDNHALNIAKMAFSMLNAMKTLKDPSDKAGKDHLKLRVGIHSGTVVAGVVGLKMPRYCLFGDTVNTASRMESSGEAMKIHCSEATKICMANYHQYSFEERGTVDIKGKGAMHTYWLSNDGKTKKETTFKCSPSGLVNEQEVTGTMTPDSPKKKRLVKHKKSRESIRICAPDTDSAIESASPTSSTHTSSIYQLQELSADLHKLNLECSNRINQSIATVEPSPVKPEFPQSVPAVDPSPVKSAIQDEFPTDNSIPGYGQQKGRRLPSGMANNGCSTTCIIS